MHRKLQALNFDRNPSGRMLASDFKQHGRKREFEGKENKLLMSKQVPLQSRAIKLEENLETYE